MGYMVAIIHILKHKFT